MLPEDGSSSTEIEFLVLKFQMQVEGCLHLPGNMWRIHTIAHQRRIKSKLQIKEVLE